MKNKIFFLIVLFVIFVFTGCAIQPKNIESPLLNKKYSVAYRERLYTVQKEMFKKVVLERLKPQDEFEIAKIWSIAKRTGLDFKTSDSVKIGSPKTCDRLGNMLVDTYFKELSERYNWQNTFKFVIYKNTACGKMEPCSTSSSIQIKREDWNKLLVNYGLNIKWLYKGRYAYPSQQGDAVVSLKIDNFQCKSGTEITAELTAKIDKIDNPKLLIKGHLPSEWVKCIA